MTNDYAMTTLNRLLARPGARQGCVEPIDPAMRDTVDRLIGELRAINFRPAAR